MKYSVILPVFNGERYVAQAIESVCRQKVDNWELLVIDDGSSDSTAEICSRFAAEDSRIRYFPQKNAGVSAARNRGIELARGEYILFLDADDWFTGDCLEKVDSLLASCDADLIVFNYLICTENAARKARAINAVQSEYGPQEREKLISVTLRIGQWHDDCWYGLWRPVWGKCFRRSLISEQGCRFPEGLKIGEDAVFLLRYLAGGPKVRLAEEYLYCFRENPESVMHTRRWTGSAQGELYASCAEAAAAGLFREEDLMQLWLEAAEGDWKCIAYSDMGLAAKCRTLSGLCGSDWYRRFAGLEPDRLGGKAKAYRLCIRARWGLGLLILTFMKWKRIKL